MRDVSIVGTGTTKYGTHGVGVKPLGIRAVTDAMGNCGVERDDVDALFTGNFISGILEGQETIAPLIADNVGLSGVAAMTTEGACASSGLAFSQAYHAIAAGIHDVAVVVGVESMTIADTETFTAALGSAQDQLTEGSSGLTFAGFYGLFADRYMTEHDATHEDLAAVAVKNRSNGVSNPRAHFRDSVTVDEVIESRPVADPLNLYDCCPASDGATAVVLAADDAAGWFTDRPIEVAASGYASGRSAAYRYDDLMTFEATTTAADNAYKEAGVRPDDVDVVELHDCFTAAEVGDSEDLGFFEKGEGAAAAATGRTAVDGEIPINPSGGLLSKGHPVGATGIGEIYEVCRQLRGEHENQVPDASIGLTHNLGGSGAVCTVTVLRVGAT
jgi:acetyl-CoA C-acetyltransferase